MAANPIIHSMVAEAKRAELLRQAERARQAARAATPRPGSLPVLRRTLLGLSMAGLLSLALVGGAAAHDGEWDDDAQAYAGNGGVAVGDADGGAVATGDLTSGANAGNGVAVGDVADGSVAIDGGDVTTGTGLAADADGGVGIADASGGDENVAVEVDDVDDDE